MPTKRCPNQKTRAAATTNTRCPGEKTRIRVPTSTNISISFHTTNSSLCQRDIAEIAEIAEAVAEANDTAKAAGGAIIELEEVRITEAVAEGATIFSKGR